MTKITHSSRKLSALLMVGASGIALATPAQANDFLYTTQSAPLETGQRVTQSEPLTQIRLSNGGTASFTDNAQYQINDDGSVELYRGSVTIASVEGRAIVLRMPDGLEAQVTGRGAAANFTVQPDGEASGHTLTGTSRIGRAGRLRGFKPGDMWAAAPGDPPRRVVANAAQTAPEANSPTAAPQVAAIGDDAGPVGAALNGIPVTLGDALAGASASSDILLAARRVELGVGNPLLDTFPSGDLALLIDRAAQIEFANGGSPFPQAQADIIRAYLRFLAGGGSGAQFLSTFSAFSLDYLDLIRAGGVPSGFANAGLADINAYLAFIDRTGALAQLAQSDRVLAQAYLGFLRDGGNPDLFATSFTDLTDAYFAFVRAGNSPADFQGASQAVLAQTIAFLSDSGLTRQLSEADQALVSAFLINGGLAFAGQFQTALDEYFSFLASGNRPSAYEPVDQATLRQFLETLSDTGLLASVLGDQAQFYADYLAFLRGGGDIDAFAGLPVNIFTDYANQLAAYRAFLESGNRPSAFTASNPAQLQAFIAELQAAGALENFVGADAAFFAAFAAFVDNGGVFDAFGGLNANIFTGYAADLQAYFAFLEAGGVPSTYEPLTQAVIAQYLADLQAAGATARFLPELGDFYAAYFAFLSQGGNPDNFAQLPVPPDFGAFAAALNAYADFLQSGGFPADFTDSDLSVLASFIAALGDAGELDARLGANADLLEAYFAFLANGGAPNAFAGLPVFTQYVADLNAYFAFLAGGGLPQDYTVLDQATLNAYLAALSRAQGGLTGFGNLDTFFADYAAFVLGGGNPTNFAGLPVFTQYVADLNAYFAFLAGGGLPQDYTVLDQATLNAYLAALSSAQGGLTGFGNLDGFFEAYAAFVLGGGDPTAFAGLPVFAQYVADLNAYFAFLAAGGVPSEYTVLDQATINAYLALLAGAQGGLSGFSGLDGFFIDFFAFIQGGGNADLFAGLPANAGGGNPGGTEGRLAEYLGGFTNGAGLAYATFGGNSQDGRGAPTLDANGGLIEAGRISNIDANIVDIAGDDLAVLGTYTNGDAMYLGGVRSIGPNGGLPYVALAPITGDFPTSGTIDYEVLAATRPVFMDEAFGPGTFDGTLSLRFGPTPGYRTSGTITMPEATGNITYNFASAGAANGDFAAITTFETQFVILRGEVESDGRVCATGSSCQITFLGNFAGEDPEQRAGFVYDLFASASQARIGGAVIYAPVGMSGGGSDGGSSGDGSNAPTGSGTPLILASASDFAATSGVKYNLSAPATRLNGFDLPTFTLAANGALTSASDGVSVRSIGSTTATDISGNDRFLIGRWTDGEYEVSQGSEPSTLTSAQGFHYMLAGPTTGGFTVPTMGSIEYELIAATAPTIADGSLAPGQFEAGMTVLFGSAPTVAMEGSITLPTTGADYVYSFASTGGLANPDQSDSEFRVRFGRNINFEFRGDQITTSDNSCNENCVIQFAGYFAGDDALEMGLTYTAQTETIGRAINGAAIFGNGVFDDGMSPSAGGAASVDGMVPLGGEGSPFAYAGAAESGAVSAETMTVTNGVFIAAERRPVRVSYATTANSTVEVSGDQGVIGWQRINAVATVYSGGTGQVFQSAPFVEQYWHTIWGAPLMNMPTMGLINYEFIGGSTAHQTNARPGDGVFSGRFAVDFATLNAGLEATVTLDGPDAGVFDFASAGGVAAPSMALRDDGFGTMRFSDNLATTERGVGAVTRGTTVFGFLAGDGATHAGLTYRVRKASGNSIMGTAAFRAAGQETASALSRTAASIAPSLVPAAMTGGSWARWGGSGSASPQGLGITPSIDLLPPGVQPTEARLSAQTRSHEAVIHQAERIMGGAITFARPGEVARPR